MTRLRWTEPASQDFLGIVEWLKARNPAAAAKVGRHILDSVKYLVDYPNMGKPGRSPDTRELPERKRLTRAGALILKQVARRWTAWPTCSSVKSRRCTTRRRKRSCNTRWRMQTEPMR